jgi:hypothetical protein
VIGPRSATAALDRAWCDGRDHARGAAAHGGRPSVWQAIALGRSGLQAAETRLTATRDALASIPAEAPRDDLLDFALNLRETIAGKTADAHSTDYAPGTAAPPDIDLTGLTAAAVAVEPVLRPEVASTIWQRWSDTRPSPMAWFDACEKSVNSQEQSPVSLRMALLPLAA